VLAGQMFLRPFLRRSFSTRRPVLLCMRVRKPEVRRRALTVDNRDNKQSSTNKTCQSHIPLTDVTRGIQTLCRFA
jgi:hypothetical protein